MDDETSRRAAFKLWMDQNEITMAAIARATEDAGARVPESTIRSYLSGKAQSLKGSTQQRIADAFGVTVDQMFRRAAPNVEVAGKIGARAEVYPLDGAPIMYEIPLPPTLDPAQGYVAFEIDGFSMPPAMPGWVVVFLKREIPLEDLVNTPCMVDLADGRRLFKTLRKGYELGLWNLESWDGSPLIENVEIVGALPFAALVPGKSARK